MTFDELVANGEKKGYFHIEGDTITYLVQAISDQWTDAEEKVRAGIFHDLIERYAYKNTKKTIVLELLRKIGHPHKKSDSRLDILVNRPDGTPFMMFELKSPDEYEKYFEDSIATQLFERAANEDKGSGNLRFLIYYTRSYEDAQLREKYVTIDYSKFKTFEQWEENGRTNLRYIPRKYDIKDRPPQFTRGGKKGQDLRIDVRRDELNRVARELHNILWGGGKYQNELFFNLIGLFLAKIWDEKKTKSNEAYEFQIFFDGDEQESSQEVYARMNKLYREALKNLLQMPAAEIAKKPDIIFDANKVKYVVEVLQEISFLTNRYDVLGDFFERIVRGELKQTKGQYLTHQNIVDFILYALGVDDLAIKLINTETRLPFIVDPACGSGTFLIHAMKLITGAVEKRRDEISKSYAVDEFLDKHFLRLRKNGWADEFVYGIEINADLAMASKVNMVGHGDGSAHIETQDGLTAFSNYHDRLKIQSIQGKAALYKFPVNEQFDVVVSNPPFSIQVDKDTAKELPATFERGKKIYDSIKKKTKGEEKSVDTENLFLERWYQLLAPGGRLGVVLPESVFDTATNRDIRLFLFKYFWVRAIVSLPTLAFAPYTTTKTSLLFAQKKNAADVTRWTDLWTKHEGEFKRLKKVIDKASKAKNSAKVDRKQLNAVIEELLADSDTLVPEDDELNVADLLGKYKEQIGDSTWWIFRRVARVENISIFMAHAQEIGYKRGTLREDVRPNCLFTAEARKQDDDAAISIDTSDPSTILDYLRKVVVWN